MQNNWLRRVMLDLERPEPHVESFFIKANDPKHDRAVWLRLTLFSDGKETYGEAWAIYTDPARGAPLVIKERWPVSRILADPERPGVGVGPCAIEEGRSYGLVHGQTHSLAWDLALDDEQPEYRHLPSERLYKSQLLSNKLVSPHPSAALRGRIEIWEAKQRRSDCERVDLGGWRGMQGHNWGKGYPDGYLWAHCNLFTEAQTGAYFEAIAARPKIAGILQPSLCLGRLVVGEQVYRFDTWASLGGRHKSEQSGLGWKFALSGPDGTLDGEVRADPKRAVALTYPSPGGAPLYCVNSKVADLTLTLTPKHGASRSLHSRHAALEIASRKAPADVALSA